MNRLLPTVLILTILMFVSTATRAATIEVAGGPYFPLVDKDDIVESGYEVTLGLSSTVQTWLMVSLSAGYSHLKTVESITIPNQHHGPPEEVYDPGDWDIYNISLDARFGWGLEGPHRFWFAAGLGWYHLSAEDATYPHEWYHTEISANDIGVRLSAGGSLYLSNHKRIGTVVRYSYTDFSNKDYDPVYLAGVQAQLFLGFDL